MLSKFLFSLLALFSLGVVGPDEGTEVKTDVSRDDEPDGDDEGSDLETLLAADDEDGKGKDDKDEDEDEAGKLRRENKQLTERLSASDKAKQDADERLRSQTTNFAPTDPDYEREETLLKSAREKGDQAYFEDLNRTIQNNRAIRETVRIARSAEFRAAESEDKADFRELAADKPRLYKRYAPKIEQVLSEMRRNGKNAPRRALFYFMVGKETAEGSLKIKTKGAAKGERQDAENVVSISRGRSPSFRSNVSAKGESEHEKRTKRLENQRI